MGWFPRKPEPAPLTLEELQGQQQVNSALRLQERAAVLRVEEKKMEEKMWPATGKDLIEALTVAGLVTRFSLGIGSGRGDLTEPSTKLKLTDAGAALLLTPDSPVLGFIQIPGIFVKETPTEPSQVGR